MSTVATFLVAMSSTVLLSVSSKLSKKKARKPFQFKLILRKVSEEKNHLEGLGFFLSCVLTSINLELTYLTRA